jgi:peptide/nickel transport system permease protein
MNWNYIAQRLVFAVIVILGVTFAVFIIMQMVPGDPARVILGVQATDESVAALRERLGLNEPFFQQYFSWLADAIQGDLGSSLITGQAVAPQITGRLPATIQLSVMSLLVGMLIAFPLGILSAIYRGSAIDTVASLVSQIGVSIPDFWLGILLVLLFSLNLRWLPPSGYDPIRTGVDQWLEHLILPAVTAGVISGSIQTRFIRSAMIEVLNANYIRTARAKGLPEWAVISRHALRNALINIVTIMGLQITALFSSIVAVEIVFAWPGLGRLALEAVLDRDYPLVQGAVLTFAVMVTLINLLIDLLYFLLDPRIEYS